MWKNNKWIAKVYSRRIRQSTVSKYNTANAMDAKHRLST